MIESAPAAACSRCGTFVTAESLKLIDAKVYCLTCAVRPDVDYLEAFRLKHWGKRDLWAWLVAIGGALNLLMVAAILIDGSWLEGQTPKASAVTIGTSITSALVAGAFFAGRKWARIGLLANLLASTTLQVVVAEQPFLAAFPGLLIGTLVAVAILGDTRNQLFFKLEVSRGQLRKAWDLYANNSIARMGYMLAILSILIWPLGVVALPLSLVGLSRVAPQAMPPVGRKWQAVTGVIVGGITTLVTLGLVVSFALRPRV